MDYCFVLRIRLFNRDYDPRVIVIRAYDDLIPQWDWAGRTRLTVDVRHGGKVIFPKGQLTCAVHGASDSKKAKELVMALVAMRPGDTDPGYFADYTHDQLEWANTYGEALGVEREYRYCDPETGSVRED